MMECGNHLKLRAACCSSKNIPSILQGVEARDARCVCCKEQTSYKFNHKMFGTVSDPDEPCEGDCYRPIYTKEANLQSCEPDNSDCASLLENKGLTCDNPDKPQLKLEPTCCSENKDNQDVPRVAEAYSPSSDVSQPSCLSDSGESDSVGKTSED
ncbi:unnamed protein product [Orchesella dallaii]|uniref:Uncharacterized protein n=1 Tax=Orchesella dallaii TaxID=48710 RepID=A0ABP1Q4U2_9HEXA